jgi:hypothetical protein
MCKASFAFSPRSVSLLALWRITAVSSTSIVAYCRHPLIVVRRYSKGLAAFSKSTM